MFSNRLGSVICFILLSLFVNTNTQVYNCTLNYYEEKICVVYNCTTDEVPPSILIEPEYISPITNTVTKFNCMLNEELSQNRTKDDFKFSPSFEVNGTWTKFFFLQLKSAKRSKLCLQYPDELNPPLSNKICTIREPDLNENVRMFQTISTFICPVFILMTICTFLCTLDIQNFHGWTHFTNGLCVFTLYISWGLRYIFFRGKHLPGTWSCFNFGWIQHYFHLSVFAWLVVANQDLLKISESHFSGRTLDIKRQIVSYIRLSIFGWGIPAVYMGICTIFSWICIGLGMSPDSYAATYILASYGKYRCFLQFNAYWIHLTLPTFTLFVLAMYYSWKTLNILRTKNNESNEQAAHRINLIRNKACLTALVLTSVCWGCDVLRSFMTAYDRSAMLWFRVLLDFVIMYQTIPIFILYTCRPHILNHIEIKYPPLSGAISLGRKVLYIPQKEYDPGLITQLRIHRKSDAEEHPRPPDHFCLHEIIS